MAEVEQEYTHTNSISNFNDDTKFPALELSSKLTCKLKFRIQKVYSAPAYRKLYVGFPLYSNKRERKK